MTMGNKLRKLRKEHNMTEEEFAEIWEVPVKIIRMSERNKYGLPLLFCKMKDFTKMAEIFDVPVEYFLNKENRDV